MPGSLQMKFQFDYPTHVRIFSSSCSSCPSWFRFCRIKAHVRRLVVAATFLLLGANTAAAQLQIGQPAPDLRAETWINSPPLTLAGLRGKVVLVEFWTFACFNCRNVEPHVKAWYERYSPRGLAVVAVHSPELSHERELASLRSYVREHGLDYPIAVDNDFAVWKRFHNSAWPALYLIDKRGILRRVQVGEGGYDDMEHAIEALL
jgi:peroxiredoxin